MLPILVLVVAVPVAAVLAIAATKPNAFRVVRRTHIGAAPEAVYALVEDFHRWPAWSPWEGMDPDMTRAHSGAERGSGAVYEWKGNRKVGRGRMEIQQAVPPSEVLIKLDFLEPFEAHNMAEFALQPAAGGTDVSWTMSGNHTFVGKLFSVFMPMDRLVGKDFERGLANLKRAAEQPQ
jgi:uncharacterized protein YndB with AHSA1/START domain